MSLISKKLEENLGGVFLCLMSLPLLWGVSTAHLYFIVNPAKFIFLHNIAEIFAIVVSMFIFITGYHAIFSARKGAVIILAICFFDVGALDLMHTLSYAGMPEAMTANSSQKSIFFWLSARIVAAAALLSYIVVPAYDFPSVLNKRIATGTMLLLLIVLAYVGLFNSDSVPSLFIVGKGLTKLKVDIEWFIVSIDLITLFAIWFRQDQLPKRSVIPLVFATLLSAISELFFTRLGVIDKDSANLIGHLYKVIAYLYLFRATVNEALHWPLRQKEVQFFRENVMLEVAPSGILLLNDKGRILKSNSTMTRMTGWPTNLLVGTDVDVLLPAYVKIRDIAASRELSGSDKLISDFDLICRDGRTLPVDISIGSFTDETSVHTIVYARDMSERKKLEHSLRYQAMHDELTGLPNRRQFREWLDLAISQSVGNGQRVALLFLDLDYFKSINDSFGHVTGDALLIQVAHRLEHLIASKGIVARLGGDEFAIYLTEIDSASEAVHIANDLLSEFLKPFDLEQQEVYSSTSIGLAFYPDDANDSNTLLRYADMAMYRAKQAGRGTFACFSSEMNLQTHEDLKLHTRLKAALEQGLLDLHYQPQVDVHSGRIVGVEALLRWTDPILGIVSPARMIPIAEATGLILPLSKWVLHRACQQIAEWTEAGFPLCVAVNFSAQLFRQQDLIDTVSMALSQNQAKAEYLCIEITESVAMMHPQEAHRQLMALVAMGCSIALDDFGTGFSSLAYLKTLPVSKLKIDKTRVQF
ncbi:bifunctional diguanylate cyclase/phosphodiesterase [Undibacterium sp. RuRC25W]|uniref:bifunctional diguanylate cyclase/phosphodiesterase n=1 Tax=Undibacterium sp. RuRC25W TaxID=3413047 RepID=UPI003BF0386E